MNAQPIDPPNDGATWTGTARGPWVPIIAVALIVVATGFLFFSVAVAVVFVFSAFVVVTLSRIRVTVDASGLSIAYGPWGWPRQHIARPTIISARVDNIRPLRWGGWGYRGSLILFRRAAVVLRAGPGLVLELQGGRRLAITVDDPEGALRLLPAAPPT